jgi:8-oxo-dGTP pyrophosphatase MutT (NUDIX family)
MLECKVSIQQPTMTVAMKHAHQLDGLIMPDWPPIFLHDYVIALVINEAGEAMILERQKPGGGAYWQMMKRYLNSDEDPFTAVQQELLEQTGCQTGQWSYLGSHVVDTSQPVGVGYFFCAQQACKAVAVEPKHRTHDGERLCLKWVSLTDLRYALLDGRLAMTNHALTVSLAFLTILK